MGIRSYVCAKQRDFSIEVRAAGESSACCGVNLAPPVGGGGEVRYGNLQLRLCEATGFLY